MEGIIQKDNPKYPPIEFLRVMNLSNPGLIRQHENNVSTDHQ